MEVDIVHIILMGPPGAGKGTQAALIAEQDAIPHISTGDIFRANMSQGTPLGLLAKQYVDAGKYVPDDVTNAMVNDRLSQPDCLRGFILDGYPRTTDQADKLNGMLNELGLKLDAVVIIELPDSLLVERAEGRRLCRNCGAIHNISSVKPGGPGVCEKCAGELYQRSDDTAAKVSVRLQEYHGKTAPVLQYYRDKGLVQSVNGDQSVDAVTDEIRRAVKA